MFIEILFNMILFKGGVLIYAEHCNCANNHSEICHFVGVVMLKKKKKIWLMGTGSFWATVHPMML